jgi:cytochrome c biogenesis factor
MAAELGHFSAILALWLAVTQAAAGLWGARRSDQSWVRVARRAARAQ